jgi:multicomponent Na+:H+ antiporter subunit B
MMDKPAEHGMTLIVKTVTKLTLGFILLYGIYIALSSHSIPGGGFAGGVIVALSLVHVMLAFGKETALHRLHAGHLRLLMCASGLVFTTIVVMGFKCAGFLAETVIPLCQMLIVGAGLFAVFVALVLLSKMDADSEEGR